MRKRLTSKTVAHKQTRSPRQPHGGSVPEEEVVFPPRVSSQLPEKLTNLG